MKRKYVKKAVSFGLAAVTALVLAGPAAGSRAMAADTKLTIKEAQINQLPVSYTHLCNDSAQIQYEDDSIYIYQYSCGK